MEEVNEPIAWMSFDGKLVLHGKERDPAQTWEPLGYFKDTYELLEVLTKENKELRDMLAQTMKERDAVAQRWSPGLIPMIPKWCDSTKLQPPLNRPLIGLWFDDDDHEDYELMSCTATVEDKNLVWEYMNGTEIHAPPHLWMLAPPEPMAKKVPF